MRMKLVATAAIALTALPLQPLQTAKLISTHTVRRTFSSHF